MSCRETKRCYDTEQKRREQREEERGVRRKQKRRTEKNIEMSRSKSSGCDRMRIMIA